MADQGTPACCDIAPSPEESGGKGRSREGAHPRGPPGPRELCRLAEGSRTIPLC